MSLYTFVYIYFILNNFYWKQQISTQICKLVNTMNADEVCPWMLMRRCLLAMLMLVNLLLMLLYLNIDYADTNEDLCIRIMSLSGTSINFFLVGTSPCHYSHSFPGHKWNLHAVNLLSGYELCNPMLLKWTRKYL